MRGVVQNKKYYQDFGVEVKPARPVPPKKISPVQNHGLFVGYAPYDNPEVSMAIRIANGYSSLTTPASFQAAMTDIST